MERIEKVIDFINKEFGENIQIFYTRNIVGDPMETVYHKDGIIVDSCYQYGYLEVFGMTPEEKKKMHEVFKKASFYDDPEEEESEDEDED